MEEKKKRKSLDEYIGITGRNVTAILIIAIITSIFVGGILSILSPILGLYGIYFVFKQRNDPKISKNTKILRVILIVVWLVAYGFFVNLKSTQPNVNGQQESNAQSNATWQTFNSVDGDFRIDFPNMPEKEVSPQSVVNGITINSTTYTSNESDNDIYMVAVYSYDITPDNYDTKNGLEGMVNGFVNNIENASLASSSYSTFGQYQAVDFIVNVPDQNMNFIGKAIVRDDLPTIKAYLLVSGATIGMSTKHDQFVNSFAITD